MCGSCNYSEPDEWYPEEEEEIHEGHLDGQFADDLSWEGWTPLGEVVDENAKLTMSLDNKMEFFGLLMADDSAALIAAASVLDSRKQPPPRTEVSHTLWTGQQDSNGFYVYHVTHNLGTRAVKVTLDTNEMFTYSVKDENTVAIVAPDRLWGVDVNVEVK